MGIRGFIYMDLVYINLGNVYGRKIISGLCVERLAVVFLKGYEGGTVAASRHKNFLVEPSWQSPPSGGSIWTQIYYKHMSNSRHSITLVYIKSKSDLQTL